MLERWCALSIEEELKVSFKNPLSIVLTLIAVVAYLLLLAVYQFNRPDPTILGMSTPLVYAFTLWIIIVIVIIVAAARVWG
ncbi:MAG: hypothetical protein QXR02_00650 [Acidilobaceae archaeon]